MDLVRRQRITDALSGCVATLGDQALSWDTYTAWREALPAPYSVPSPLAIAGNQAEFVHVCAELGFTATKHSPAPPPQPNPAPATDTLVWSIDNLTAALTACAATLGRPPSAAEYRAWQSHHDRPAPTTEAIAAAGWNRHLYLAGLSAPTKRRTDTEIWAHVVFVRDRLGTGATKTAYEQLRRSCPQRQLVSASTLMKRTGRTWSELFA